MKGVAGETAACGGGLAAMARDFCYSYNMRGAFPVWVGLLAALLLLPAATPRPVLAPPQGPGAWKYTIQGGSLTILSHPDYREFRYEDGVTFSGDGIELSAGRLVVNVTYGDLAGREKIKLPEPEPGALERDPPGAAAKLAREVYLPSPELTPDMLKLIEAGGGVTVRTGGLELSAPALASTDGGQTWRASGGAHATVQDERSSGQLQLDASEITYNITSKAGSASGRISGVFSQPGKPELKLSAQRITFDIAKQQLNAAGELKAASAEYALCCGALAVDLAAQTVRATGGPQITYSTRQLSFTAQELSYDLAGKTLTARGGVSAHDGLSQASLTAEQIVYEAAADRLTATGQPRVEQGGSSYTGEVIRAWREEDGKAVVEVEGKQSGKLDLSGLRTKAKASKSAGAG